MFLIILFQFLLGYQLQSNSHISFQEQVTDTDSSIYQSGFASYYGRKFNGLRTSSGQIHRSDSLMCAHRTLPFGTKLLVTNVRNHKKIMVTVNDRGPFVKGRILDLSNAAADSIGLIRTGTAFVTLRIIN